MANQKPDFVAYTIVETNEDNKDYWQRVGSAWTNKDGSINVTLNALPLNGKLHIRAPKADEEKLGALIPSAPNFSSSANTLGRAVKESPAVAPNRLLVRSFVLSNAVGCNQRELSARVSAKGRQSCGRRFVAWVRTVGDPPGCCP